MKNTFPSHHFPIIFFQLWRSAGASKSGANAKAAWESIHTKTWDFVFCARVKPPEPQWRWQQTHDLMKDVWISCASSLSSRNGVSFAICPSTIRTSKPWLLWLLGLPQLCLFLPCLPLPSLLLRFFEDYFSLQTWLQVMRVDFWWYLDTLVRNMAWTSPPSWGPLKGYARLVWYGCPRGGRLWKRVDSRASSRDCCQHLRCIRGLRKSINWHWINSTSLLALWGRLKSCHVRFVNAPKDTCEIVGQPIPSKRAGSLAWNFFDGLSRAGVWCWLASAVSGWGVVDDDSWLVLNGLEQFKGIQIAFRSCNPWVCVFFFGGVVLDCFIFFLGLIGKSKINQKYIISVLHLVLMTFDSGIHFQLD